MRDSGVLVACGFFAGHTWLNTAWGAEEGDGLIHSPSDIAAPANVDINDLIADAPYVF